MDDMVGAVILAAKNGNKESLLAALDRGADINEKDNKGLTSLHWAALNNKKEILLLLLERGARVDLVDHKGATPLHWAAQKNCKDTAQILLEHSADVNAINNQQNTALHWTSFRDCYEAALVLLSHGVDVDAVNGRDSTALHTAAMNNSARVVRLLLHHSANVNSVDNSGNSALHLAAMNNRDKIVSILIKHGANVNLANADGRTPLQFAVNHNCKKTAFILVNEGADVGLVGPHGNTVLHWAVENSNKELVQYLIERGADVNAEKGDGRTALHIATENNNAELVAFLVKHGANINAKNCNGDTALTLGSKTNKEVALLLVDKGADVNAANETSFPQGHTALHWAAMHNNRELAVCLLAKNANVNAANRIGHTALHSAAECNSKEVAHLLMEHDANVDPVSRNDETPLSLAVGNNCKDVAVHLLQRGASVRVRNKDGNSVLHWAATNKNEELSLLLLRHGADINTINIEGKTALHCAAQASSMSVAQLLVQHGANVNTKDRDGNTPLHFAVDKSSKDICLLLLTHGAVVDTFNKKGNNALHLASNTDDEELASVLAKNIEHVDALNKDGDTALHRAVTRNNRIVASVLLDHGANVNTPNRAGNTPLHCACMQETGEAMICLFLRKGAVVDCRNKMGLTSLHVAVTDGNFDMVGSLLEHGAKVNLTDDLGNSPLHLAILNKKFKVSSLLLKQPNIHVNKFDEDGKSPFHLLAQVPAERDETKKAIAEIARDLIGNGASVNIRNILDETPLHLARNVCTAEVLLESGAWPNVRENYGGNTPLLSQAKALLEKRAYNHEKSELEKVVESGMDPWIANDEGETLLAVLLAKAQAEDFETVRSLIDVMKDKSNCNINKKHTNGETLLHIVCTSGKDESLELLELLFKSHVNVNVLNAFCETPLHLVCRAITQLPEGSSSSQVFYWSARQLIANGADATLKESKGETCLTIARDVPQLLSLLTSPVDLTKIPQLLKWSEPKSHKHKSKVAEVVRGRNSFQIQNYHCHKEPIGKGGFSLVYAGVDEKDGREVAVKCIVRDRLCRPEDQREISNLVKLCNCEDVVRYYCCIDQKRFIYIVLELMEGTLDDLLNDPNESIHIAEHPVTLCEDVVRGLCFFHARNVLHRDIKPGNILYKKSPRICLKIADFGLSTSAAMNASVETASVMHTFAGTRCWMAPELLQGPRRVAHSFESDVFASGLVLHYILDGKKHPFSPVAEKDAERSVIDLQNGTERNIMMQNLNISDQLAPEARHLIRMMLSKEKESRPIAGAIIGHPLFWSRKKKVRFLIAVGNQPEFHAPRHLVREHSAVEKELENSLDPTFATDPWDFAVYPTFVEMTSTGGRRYDTCSTIELVRFIRNAQAHVSDTSRSAQFKQDVLESFVFLEKFPFLLIVVYKAITSNGWDIDRAEIKSVLFDE